jgi:ubiquinone/menaquinone biosynthesis C-methylase UbiE
MTLQRLALTGLAVVIGGGAVFAATPFGRDVMFHFVPIAWTGEAARLASAAGIGAGTVVADIGAGNGALITELARIVGPQGRAFATERTADNREAIRSRADAAAVAITVIEAGDHATNLPDDCCDAITMRMVLHHIADPGAFARDLRRAVRDGGRVGIIDFLPGALPHLADDHGVSPEAVAAAFEAAGFETLSRDLRWGGRTYLIVFRAP